MMYIAPIICRRLKHFLAAARVSNFFPLLGSVGLWLAYTAVAVAQPASAALDTGSSANSTASRYQAVATLEAAAKTAAENVLPPLTERQRFVVGPVQSTLQLEHCKQALQSLVSAGQHMKDRVMVEVRCPDMPASTTPRGAMSALLWHIYVPVRVVGTSSVVIAAHSIVMGAVLSANDLRVEQHDMSELPLGFLDDPGIAVGLTAARAIAGGSMLTNQQLMASKVVQRGQSVTLVADAGGMSVRMAGKALSDGMMNQRVKVQNLSSGKVVEGVARSEQVVEIVFQ